MNSTSDHEMQENNQNSRQLVPESIRQIGLAANRAAARYRFADYQQRHSEETLRRQRSDLNLFHEFLSIFGLVLEQALFAEPEAWRPITWGLVEGFVKWQLDEGYAIQSVNVRLSTVKVYAKLAMQCGVLTAEEYAMIRAVTGYTHKEGIRIDQKREISRVGFKKEDPVRINAAQAALLKQWPDNPQGRRDTLLMCLLLDHGLRVGEVADLLVEDLDLDNALLVFYRSKVAKTQKHYLSDDAYQAALRCSQFQDFLPTGPLLRRSVKGGNLGESGISVRGITHRVKILGERIGMDGLSPHDCRHYWATLAARSGTDPFVLQEAGGWSSLAMPRRYVEENEIANEGLRLGDHS